MIHVQRGLRSPLCAENANNVRCLCWRESVALTVSHPSLLGRREGRNGDVEGGREGGMEEGSTLGSVGSVGGRGKEEQGGRGRGELARTSGKSRRTRVRVCVCACVCVSCICVPVSAWWSSDTADTCHLGFSAVKLN